MKKTRRLLSVLALLMAALMLFSSCAISYKEVNPGDYVQFVDGFDFKSFKLAAETKIEQMIVKDEDVEAHINKLLFALREEVKNSEGKPHVNQPGPFNKYDTLSIRTVIYDKDGKLVAYDFSTDSKTPKNEDGTLNLTSDKALYLGYGTGLNTGLMQTLEEALYLSAEDVLLMQNYLVVGKNVGGSKTGALGAMPAIGFVSYSTTYKKADGNDHDAPKGKITAATFKHFEKIGNDIAADGAGKGDKYDEILYLGLKELIERQASIDGKQITPAATTGKDTALTIKVYPTATGIPEEEGLFGDKSTAIAYDINFEDPSATTGFSEGTITVWLQSTIDFTFDAVTPGAFVTSYTYPDDAAGNYVSDSSKKLKDAGECSVYVYITERAPFTRPDYNADTVKNKLEFATDKTEDAEVIEEYEASIKSELQEKCDAITKKAAKEALWEALMANTKLIKDPVRNIKNYRREVIDAAKANYYDGGLSLKTQTDKNGNVIGYYYDDFDHYLTVTFYPSFQQQYNNGDTTYKKNRQEIDDDLYARGRELVKLNLVTYYLADLFDCRFTDAELLEMAQKRGAAWAQEQIKSGRDYIIETNTVEKLSSQYTDKTKREQFFKTNEVESFEEYLEKLLGQYSEAYGETFENWEQVAKKIYPDDYLDWEDYVEYMQGEESLYGTYHYELVLEKLYEANLANLEESYEEAAYDANKAASK